MKTEHAPLNAPLQDALKALGWQDRVLLAPMSGVTDRPFRDYIRNLGQGQVVTEMIASEAAIRQVKDSRKLNQAIDDEPGIIVTSWLSSSTRSSSSTSRSSSSSSF